MKNYKEINEGVLGAVVGGGVGGAVAGGPVGALAGMTAGHKLQKALKDRKGKKEKEEEKVEEQIANQVGESIWNTYRSMGALIAEVKGFGGAKALEGLKRHTPKAIRAKEDRKRGPKGRKEAGTQRTANKSILHTNPDPPKQSIFQYKKSMKKGDHHEARRANIAAKAAEEKKAGTQRTAASKASKARRAEMAAKAAEAQEWLGGEGF